jgi:cytoskeletal protein CcmA (bactofilin family)
MSGTGITASKDVSIYKSYDNNVYTYTSLGDVGKLLFTSSYATTNKWSVGSIGYVKANYGIDQGYPGGLAFNTKPPNNLADTNLTTRMVIDANGNVGINNTNPQYKLDVNGTGNITGAVTCGTLNCATNCKIIENSATTGFKLMNSASGLSATGYAILQDNLGITRINSTGTASTGYGTYFNIDDVTKMYLKYDGNFGIGTTNPQYKLDVNGTANITGQLNTTTINNNGNIFLDGLTGGWEQSATRGIGYGGIGRATGVDGFSGMDIQSVNAPSPYNGNYSQNLRFFTHYYGTGTGITPRMFIQYNGNVGIGTITPSYT